MSISSILDQLNSGYSEITDLIPNRYSFTDECVLGVDKFDIVCNQLPLGNVLLRLSNGKLIWGGISGGLNVGGICIRRYNSDYTLDETFNSPEIYENDTNSLIRGIVEQSDGKLVVIGHFFNVNTNVLVNGIMRLNTDGSLDETFNSGVGFTDGGGNSVWPGPLAIKVLGDDSLLVAGTLQKYDGVNVYNVIKLQPNGTLDESFTVDSINDNVHCLAVAGNGDIYIGGQFSNRIKRLNSDGSTDSGFNVGSGFNSRVYSIVIDSNGKIVVGGWFTSYNGTSGLFGICRLLSDGTFDTSFELEGNGLINNSNSGQTVQRVVIQSDGKILAGGWFDQYNGDATPFSGYQTKLIRFNANGTKDTSFDIGLGFNNLGDSWNGSRVQDILVNVDGSILVTGSFCNYQKKPVTAFAKLSSTGVLDENVDILQLKKTFGIKDGSADMYDTGNFINTNLTQSFEDIDQGNISENDEAILDSIPNTHRSIAFDRDWYDEFVDTTNDLHIPISNGVISDGSDYFGEGSSYFTNMYPGMFVLVARNIQIDEFSITGGLGSDGSTEVQVMDLEISGNTYACFMKNNIESGGSDPTVNHIILVPGSSDGLTHLTNSGNDDYDDDCIQGLSGRDHIYYILYSTRDFPNDPTMVSFDDSVLIAEKFLEVISLGDSLIEFCFDLTPKLINMSTEGSCDSSIYNGVSQQRNVGLINTERNGLYKTAVQLNDGSCSNNDPIDLSGYPNIRKV